MLIIELAMDMYLQELSFWRREVIRRIDEGIVPSHLRDRFDHLSAGVERRVQDLDGCREDDRSAIETDVKQLLRQLSREAADAVKLRSTRTAIPAA